MVLITSSLQATENALPPYTSFPDNAPYLYEQNHLTLLQLQIRKREEIENYKKVLPYIGSAIGLTIFYIALREHFTTLSYAVGSYYTVSMLLHILGALEKYKARKIFTTLASTSITNQANRCYYLLNDDQFICLGLKAGYTHRELIDLATKLGRLDIAYKLKSIIA